MGFRVLFSGRGTPSIHGKGRAWVGRVQLTNGTYTLNYEDELPGVRGSFRETPIIHVTGKAAPDETGISSAGTTQATISDGTDDSDHTVNVIIVEDRDGL